MMPSRDRCHRFDSSHLAWLMAWVLPCLAGAQTPPPPRPVAPPGALVLPALEGPRPWTEGPLLNDPARFHIAIMTDHTGGHRPGIWMKAVERVNLLRPAFVMSVGDLIEGGTQERSMVEAQWVEFLGFIDQLKMKFFFVAGNHDLQNPTMHESWRDHFGPEWYSFDYQGVHFVCLCSEDPVTTISEKQLSWVEEDLARHQDARWTLVFLHKPLWVTAESALASGKPDPTQWKKVEALLGRRPHTVFAGHVHHYTQYDRNGMKYYHLATTGGSSQLRGVPYGEFDHVTWLTMEKDGPHVTHLTLDGVLPPDVVTEPTITRFRKFLEQTPLEIAPILLQDEKGFLEGRIDLRLTNGFDAAVEVTGQIEGLPLRGLRVQPEVLRLAAGPGEMRELAVRIQFQEPIPFPDLAETTFHALLATAGVEPPLRASRAVPVIIDRLHACRRPAGEVTVDGALGEWPELGLGLGPRPLVLGATNDWTGPADASVTFAVAADDHYLYCAARVRDDVVGEGDALELRLDPRPGAERVGDRRLRRGTFVLSVAPVPGGGAGADAKVVEPTWRRAVRVVSGGYEVEVAAPVSVVTKEQGGEWRDFQLNVVVVDVDGSGAKPARVAWRGTSDLDQRNTGFGQFARTR